MTTTVSILIAFGVYLLGMIGIGIWSMRQTKGADDFFLGGRGLSRSGSCDVCTGI